MTDTRERANRTRRITRLARRLPLSPIGLVVLGAAAVTGFVDAAPLAAVLSLLALALLLADRFVWRHAHMTGLRARYRALGIRAEALDDRLIALRESEVMHRSLTETFGDLAVQITGGPASGGRIALANAGFRTLFPDADGLPVAFKGDAAEGEAEVETALGPRVLAWRALPTVDARGRPATRWIARDVTETVRAHEVAATAAREAQHRAEAKGRYLAIAAHEIRNPLSGIAGMAELLGTGTLDAHARAQVTAITRSTQALQAVLDDIMDDARMEADKLTIECEAYDLGAVLEGVCELAAPQAHEKGVDIALHVARHGPDAVPLHLKGDADRVRQIVANLVGNALKFTASGGVAVTACISDGLRIEVTDTGPGLTENETARIFDVFASGGDEAEAQRLARRLGGVGLGLAISRRLAVAMGGTLDVVSQPGSGSTFTLTLPAEPAGRPLAETLEGQEVALVTDCRVLAGPLRSFVEERGGRLVLIAGEAWTGAWTRGPTLIDEAVTTKLPEGAVLLVRDTRVRAPAARWLRLPWRGVSLERALAGKAHVDAVEPSVLRAAIDTGGPGLRVLVAEDDPVTQLLTTAVLERAGHRVTLAATGHDAARLYREAAEATVEGGEPFAAVLLDVNLTVSGETGMDGMAALRGIRAIEKAREMAPVALHVVTGDARAETEAEAMAADATSVLLKPVPVEVLAGLVGGKVRVAA